jgi:Xaa-Pro aminopeptidase
MNNTITEDTPLSLDVGGIFYGYTAQASRTIIGKRPVNSKLINNVKTLYNSIEKAFQASGPKATLKTICNAAMKELHKKIEPESCFGILHSTGIDFYEPPLCTFENPTDESVKKGMILSLKVFFSNKNIPKEKLKIIDCFQITDNGAQRILRGILTDPPLQITHHNFE